MAMPGGPGERTRRTARWARRRARHHRGPGRAGHGRTPASNRAPGRCRVPAPAGAGRSRLAPRRLPPPPAAGWWEAARARRAGRGSARSAWPYPVPYGCFWYPV